MVYGKGYRLLFDSRRPLEKNEGLLCAKSGRSYFGSEASIYNLTRLDTH